MTLASRLALVLCGIAALSTSLALIPQELALPSELEQTARNRLAVSAAAAEQLLETHLATVAGRYRSISMTPEFRANLQTGHAPTLQYFADRLASEQSAALIAFLRHDGSVSAHFGPEALLARATPKLDFTRPMRELAFLADFKAAPFAAVVVPLRTNRELLGALVAFEPIDVRMLAAWSRLCGAEVSFEPHASGPARELSEVVAALGALELRVGATLDAERETLASARQKLLSGGALALALAFGISLLVARGLVRPIRAIQQATEPIGRGEFETRLEVDRKDEIGDVSRAFNLMADRLATSQERLLNAQILARLGNWTLEFATRRLEISEQVGIICGLPEQGDSLSDADLIARVHADDRERFRDAIERCIDVGTPFHFDHRISDAQGSLRFVHTRGVAVDPGGPAGRIEGTVQDITDRRLIEEQVRYLADYDSLTGLPNRRLFREHLDRAISTARRAESRLAVLFLDIDGFKYINDTYGHSVGDTLLRTVAVRLAECARSVEQRAGSWFGTTPSASVARQGGDEFTLLLTGIAYPDAAARMTRAVRKALAEPIELGSHQATVGASVGVAMFPEDGEDSETLLRNCDTAMHHAKARGRNGDQFYSESMNEIASKRLLLENRLRRAIEEEQLMLFFQPKVSLKNLEVCGFEALVRWQDEELGFVSPADFIPLAEETGLVSGIGSWVLREAARQIHAWTDTPLGGLPVSVNLSGRELGESTVERVAGVLTREGVAPELLELEITETAVIGGDAHAVEVLERLRSMGVRIALDDFGTGYSSLSYLRSLPIDTLKIDRSFVRNVETDSDDAALLGAIVSMAKVLDLRVVAEGIETQGQLELLKELHCDAAQGFLFCRPVSADRLEDACQKLRGLLEAKEEVRTSDL